MISQLRADSLADTSFYKDWVARGKDLRLPENLHAAMPRGRIRSLAGRGVSSAEIENSLRLSARVDALRSLAGSLHCVSSGVVHTHPFFLF